ncbi:head-tail adaptor [Microcystis phage Mae-JY09]
MLSAADIAGMRDTLDASLPGTAVIHRATYASDNQGGSTATWAAVGTAIARISPSTRQGVEPVSGGGLSAESDWVGTLPDGTDITVRDRLVHGGLTYEVLDTDRARTWDLCVRVDLARVGV